MAAGVPGADLIPDTSELFLGFTSTQKAGLGPRLIANHETLGYVDLRGGYFHGGTHMHLSHITEDLEAWYLNFDFDERVLTAFRPGLTNVKQGAQTVPQGPKDVATAEELAPSSSRRAASGTARRSRRPRGCSRTSSAPTAPSTRRAPRSRSAPTSTRSTTRSRSRARRRSATSWSTDAVGRRALRRLQPVGRRLRAQPARDGRRAARRDEARRRPRSRAQGFNSVLTTTHRQNFLVPPRRHRSFPLAEL